MESRMFSRDALELFTDWVKGAGNATLTVGSTTPGAGVPDLIKRRKWAECQPSSLCFLTVDAKWWATSHSYSPNFPATTQPRTESHSKPSLPWVAFVRCLVIAIGRAANPAGALPGLPGAVPCGSPSVQCYHEEYKHISILSRNPPLYVTDWLIDDDIKIRH